METLRNRAISAYNASVEREREEKERQQREKEKLDRESLMRGFGRVLDCEPDDTFYGTVTYEDEEEVLFLNTLIGKKEGLCFYACGINLYLLHLSSEDNTVYQEVGVLNDVEDLGRLLTENRELLRRRKERRVRIMLLPLPPEENYPEQVKEAYKRWGEMGKHPLCTDEDCKRSVCNPSYCPLLTARQIEAEKEKIREDFKTYIESCNQE